MKLLLCLICVIIFFSSCKMESFFHLHGSERKNSQISRDSEKGNYVILKDGKVKQMKKLLFEEDRVSHKGKILFTDGSSLKFYNNDIKECQTKHALYRSVDNLLARRIIKGSINVYSAKSLNSSKFDSYTFPQKSGVQKSSINTIPERYVYTTYKYFYFEKNNDGKMFEYYDSNFLSTFKTLLIGNEEALDLVKKFEDPQKHTIKLKNVLEIVRVYNKFN
jgi:outer membrane lipoprotein-sorting protein